MQKDVDSFSCMIHSHHVIKVETENMAVPVKEKKAFARYCKENGLKIYVCAAQALVEWLEKRKAGK